MISWEWPKCVLQKVSSINVSFIHVLTCPKQPTSLFPQPSRCDVSSLLPPAAAQQLSVKLLVTSWSFDWIHQFPGFDEVVILVPFPVVRLGSMGRQRWRPRLDALGLLRISVPWSCRHVDRQRWDSETGTLDIIGVVLVMLRWEWVCLWTQKPWGLFVPVSWMWSPDPSGQRSDVHVLFFFPADWAQLCASVRRKILHTKRKLRFHPRLCHVTGNINQLQMAAQPERVPSLTDDADWSAE